MGSDSRRNNGWMVVILRAGSADSRHHTVDSAGKTVVYLGGAWQPALLLLLIVLKIVCFLRASKRVYSSPECAGYETSPGLDPKLLRPDSLPQNTVSRKSHETGVGHLNQKSGIRKSSMSRPRELQPLTTANAKTESDRQPCAQHQTGGTGQNSPKEVEDSCVVI